MKSVDSKIYNKKYYLNACLGFEEYKKFKGRKVHPRILNFANLVQVQKGIHILDIGCGRGDLAIEFARRGAEVIGIDYSKDGIKIAQSALKNHTKSIHNSISFFAMNAKKLTFNSNSFDIVTSFDVFEHLYKNELDIALQEIKRVLKPDGTLLVHTETNKIYLDFTHHFWSYPLDKLLIYISRMLTGNYYPSLPKDPRNDFHKAQHVNEPTYFYLKSLFKTQRFLGKIYPIVPVKPFLSWKDLVYNIVVSLFPISSSFPLHLLFAHDFICIMKNEKDMKRS